MFTGLIQRLGTLSNLTRSGSGAALAVSVPEPWPDPLVLGESVAVQGVCLTVSRILPDGFVADVLEETLACTALGALRPGARLNLERALAVGDRLGGHIVQGHVDATGQVLSIRPRGRDFVLRVGTDSRISEGTDSYARMGTDSRFLEGTDSPAFNASMGTDSPILRHVVYKGSIAIDGVSLTVSSLSDEDGWFEVNLIPTTLRDTSLSERKPGDTVNLETDILGKYVERLLAPPPAARRTSLSLAEILAVE